MGEMVMCLISSMDVVGAWWLSRKGVSHGMSVSLSVVCVSWGMSIFSVCVSRQMKHSLAEGCNIIGMIEKFADILACFSCFTLHFVGKNSEKTNR